MPSLCGLLNFDKPAGMTSRDVVNVVQRLVRPAKAGHAGTLDPLATGVLVVCVGTATRLIPFVQEGRKVYRATFRFGASSPTDDLEGAVTEHPDAPRLTFAEVEAALPPFLGEIDQVPPAYSAVHFAGERAYRLARSGDAPPLAAKRVIVHRFEMVRFDEDSQTLESEIECGSGTYIRSLGRDLAASLGTAAVMTELRRTAVGPFVVEGAASPRNLDLPGLAAALLPPESALVRLPRVELDEAAASAVRHGRAVPKPDRLRMDAGRPAALFGPDGRLAAVAEFDRQDASLRPKIVFTAE